MKTRLLVALWIVIAAWAGFATYRWQALEKVLASRPPSPYFADASVAELEKTAFLRQFANQYFNYDENTYWKNHTALAFLMQPELREKRLAELNSQRERKHLAQFAQRASLLRIRKAGEGYVLGGSIEGREDKQEWHLNFEMKISLREIPRTIENPWGLEVQALELTTQKEAAPALAELRVALDMGKPTLLSFPCYLDHIEAPPEALQVKIISLKDSEVQFVKKKPLGGPTVATAFCQNKKFVFEIADSVSASDGSPRASDVFLDVSGDKAVARVEPKKPGAPRAKENYEKTLEQELGFVTGE